MAGLDLTCGYYLHQVLQGGHPEQIFYSPFFTIDQVMVDEKFRILFLAFLWGAGIIAVLIAVFTNSSYQTGTINITPRIKDKDDAIHVPVATGNNEYGSARFMLNDKEFKRKFSVFKIIRPGQNERYKRIDDEDIQPIPSDKRHAYKGGLVIGKVYNKREERYYNRKYSRLGKVLSRLSAKFHEHFEPKNVSENITYNMNQNFIGRQVVKLNDYSKRKSLERMREQAYVIAEDTHASIIGATRSGKTRGMVLQTIGVLALAGESMVITDAKGEINIYTEEFLKSMGYNVVVFDFDDSVRSHSYNFLQPVIDAINADDTADAVSKTWDIVDLLVERSDKSEPIWRNGETSTIAAAIMIIVVENKEKPYLQNLTNVSHFISTMCETRDIVVNGQVVSHYIPLTNYMKSLKDNHPAKSLLSISDIAPSKTRSSFYTSALTTLRLFTDANIYNITNKSDIELHRIGYDKTAFFIRVPHEKKAYYPLATLLITQVYIELISVAKGAKRNFNAGGGLRLDRRTNFVLEEFGNYPPIPAFNEKLTLAGGYGIRFMMFIQSFAQFEEKYSKEVGKIIEGNCDTWIYLKTKDEDTKEQISKAMGQYTIATISESRQNDMMDQLMKTGQSHSHQLTGRALMTVDELNKMKRPYQVVLNGDNPPAMMWEPDLSRWTLNTLYGMGDKAHNNTLIQERMGKKPKFHQIAQENIKLWEDWKEYLDDNDPDKKTMPRKAKNDNQAGSGNNEPKDIEKESKKAKEEKQEQGESIVLSETDQAYIEEVNKREKAEKEKGIMTRKIIELEKERERREKETEQLRQALKEKEEKEDWEATQKQWEHAWDHLLPNNEEEFFDEENFQ
jgi:type IV secretion system protein VirD4